MTKQKRYKFTFIYPDFEYRTDTDEDKEVDKARVFKKGGWYNEGIAQLAAIVEHAGWEVDMIHMLYPLDKKDLLNEVKKRKPDVIGINVRTDVYPYCKKVASWLKSSNIHVMAGSYHATIYPEEVIRWKGIDSLVVGEAELPLQEFLKKWPKLGNHKIGAFWFKNKDGKIIKNKPKGIIEDFDQIPFPKFEIFDFEKLLSSRSHSAITLITRGCPYNCTYCWNNFHAKIYPPGTKFVRFRSADNAIKYLKKLIKTYPKVERFRFLDDILPVYKEWREEFKGKYIKEINIPFTCNFRANFLDEDTAKFLKDIGCLYIFFGVESGNQKILDNILKRNLNKEVVLKAFRYCQKYGIKTLAYNIIGIPFEKPENMIETMKFNAILKPNAVIPMIFCPYPGTELTDMAIEAGFYDPDKPRDKYVSCKMKDFPPDHVLFAANYFREFVWLYRIAFALPKPISRVIEKIIDRIFLSNKVPRKLLNKVKEKYLDFRNQVYLFIKTHLSSFYRFAQHMQGK